MGPRRAPAVSAEPLPKTYDPAATEARWQAAWEEAGAFHPDPTAPGEPFSIVIPPPNVTGSLHMGHGFETALIDTIVRFQRLQGKNVLCLPGTDHASIAVQTLLEKQIKAEGGSKDDLGRDAFLERAWAWKGESGGTIVGQLRRLGYSVDWRRERFTLDPGLSEAVVEAFVRLHEQGLLYRGEYLVNWCPASGSAVSDLEVEMKELDGHLWHFRYPLSGGAAADGTDHLVVATTRPETLLGDTGVAVHPSDPRYASLVGQTITLPLVGRQIPIVADEHVDPAFGTGCVKVTPAHDPNDFAIGSRHGLPLITVMAKDGSMNASSGRFAGLDRFEARKAVVAAMEAEGFLVKVEPHRHSVPFSDRGKVPVEPLLSTQWFVKAEPLAARCREALDGGAPRFVPERWEKVYRDWLTDIRDWCISRQLWWGHRIPAWFVVSETGGVITEATPYVVARDQAEAAAKADAAYGEASRAAGRQVQLEQDPDVLDTWFSSGLWPFSTLGWPDANAADLARWYPTSVLVTGFDIIFFWVARMTMLAGAMQPLGAGKAWMPFADVMIHGLVRDENNRKMSKSAGNGIDPLPLIERYGADALRFALVREVAGAGQDIRLDYDRSDGSSATVEAARNFANKLWNATRFALMNLGGETPASLGRPLAAELESEDRWILSRLARAANEAAELYGSYRLGEAAKLLYEFAWNDLCDQYIEWAKPRLAGADTTARMAARRVLATSLEALLVMLHPLMPHLTEELWHAVTGADATAFLALQSWPQPEAAWRDEGHERAFQFGIEAVRALRNLRALSGVKPSERLPVGIHSGSPERRAFLEVNQEKILRLAGGSAFGLEPQPAAGQLLGIVDSDAQVSLTVPQQSLEALRTRLEKDLAKAEKEIQGLAGRLANPNFAGKAPPEVVAECRANLAEAEAQAALARQRLADLG
ncbi:valine--tRNA ligase [Cyanobium sp. Cruz CV13-4-11]|jgi:valyl-tRNA synthetase|uniref:valine--tRNA ligase n=1 Tax=unclassified Cyanobium TaxID=2627006 RepID=UPI0020CC1120|nr:MULTISPECIES: valine--tRNA ligase [unclassified Cyanobium]MCP9899499.1 valine--tRNA ligase [Cyanobium sp. Cruz CV11-17]MCP9918754.1 valine--tRNA ligase [Cyanobium sp. Cruz CV13-4-11]